ncbi:hypothetical protein B0O99DRAFT_625723 [Bisporella sp. PMI_857]|nr:hypothetical protein B0O99DRAFT_625723 [Bisporella sp. PMI_857]
MPSQCLVHCCFGATVVFILPRSNCVSGAIMMRLALTRERRESVVQLPGTTVLQVARSALLHQMTMELLSVVVQTPPGHTQLITHMELPGTTPDTSSAV